MSLLTRGFNEVESIIGKTMEYLSIPAVVGYEQYFLKHLDTDFKKLGLKTVPHPQLLEVHGKKPLSAIICIHMDRHGLISIGNKEYVYAAQYIREIKYGEENRTSRKELELIAERFEGETVYAYDPETGKKLGEGIIESCVPCMKKGESLFFVWGMGDLEPGIPLAYARTAKSRDGFLKGQIDNALSLGVVHGLFRAGFEGTALLTTEEEIGKSWLHIADYLERTGTETKDLLVLDTSPFKDQDTTHEGMIVLRTRDKSEKFNADLVNRLAERCEDLDKTYQIKDQRMLAAGLAVDDLGSTELGRLIQGHEGRWSGATVQIPTNMYHTSNETTTHEAIKNYFRFLKNILVDDPLKLDIKLAKNKKK